MKNKPSTILISSEHHNKLKELAAYDKRTIRAYIEVLIDNLSPPTAVPAPAPASKTAAEPASKTAAEPAPAPAPAPAQTMEDILNDWNTGTF